MAAAPLARERFAEIAGRPDGEIGLAEAALWIAAEEQPGLEPAAWLARLDELGERSRSALVGARDELERIERLSSFLTAEVGLRGNAEDYYDPRNSFLNEVLARGLGIPITLALVYMEVGRRAGVPLDGVGFPGHFLVRHSLSTQLLLDPFEQGRIRKTWERGATGGCSPCASAILNGESPTCNVTWSWSRRRRTTTPSRP